MRRETQRVLRELQGLANDMRRDADAWENAEDGPRSTDAASALEHWAGTLERYIEEKRKKDAGDQGQPVG
jgi:hypothetical protein